MEDQATTLNTANARIACHFHARDLYLVMGQQQQEHRSGSACSSTGDRPARPTGPAQTAMATAPSANRGCTTSSASTATSPTAASRSPSWTRASRPTPSPFG